MKDKPRGRPSPSLHSHLGASQTLKNAQLEVLPPAGVVLATDAHWEVWRQFVQVRASGDWRQVDLVMLAKAVDLEIQLRGLRDALDQEELVILVGINEIPRPNPLIGIIANYQSMQLRILARLSALSRGEEKKTIGAAARKEVEVREKLEKFDGGAGLLALN